MKRKALRRQNDRCEYFDGSRAKAICGGDGATLNTPLVQTPGLTNYDALYRKKLAA